MGISSVSSNHLHPDPRFGMHYFADTLHYREADLLAWLPALQDLGASWLVLRSDLRRAIPEPFLSGLKQGGMEPVIQFPLSLETLPDLKEISTLVDVYARWGARYLVFYDRPNDRSAWPSSAWAQQDLVERFLDRFLPLAGMAAQAGLVPVFPPLQPGGSYWDTAFLRSALQAMQRRKQEAVLQKMVLSAYAWSHDHSIDWGAGGPERWPQARPYMDNTGIEDQRGFRVFDWYLAVARSVLGKPAQILLFQAGQRADPLQPQAAAGGSSAACLAIARLLAGEPVRDPLADGNPLEPIPEGVLACNFWLLGPSPDGVGARQAWFEEDGRPGPAAAAALAWRRGRLSKAAQQEEHALAPERLIRHYLLLPGGEFGVSDWYLEVIRPFVKKHRPTVGFSLAEAEQAARVTVVGSIRSYPEDLFSRLENAGCWIEQIDGDGTTIATELAER